MAKPIYNFILYFVADRKANLGIMRAKIEMMVKQPTLGLQSIKDLYTDKDEENSNELK